MSVISKVSLQNILLCWLLIFVVKTNAQPYYYMVNYQTGFGNPGVLNNETDSYNVGWTSLISGSQTANSWSSINPIPVGFNFDFFGVPITNAKISGNGVLTFDAMATAIPSNINTNLPAIGSNIPDYSILGFWDSYTGDGMTGSNDSIEFKIFGTSPNRQIWFKYSQYEYGDNGSGGALSTCYWSIVLEETTNKVYIVDMNYSLGGNNLSATIGLQENSSKSVQFGSNNESLTNIVNGQYFNNNSYYMFTPSLLDSNNIAVLQSLAIPDPYGAGNQNVDVLIKNVGANPITTVDINWRVNGVLQAPYNYTGNLGFNDSVAVNIGIYNFLQGPSNIEIWTTMPNGVADGDMANDSTDMNVCSGLSGIFTIGSGGDYSTIDSAVIDLNNCGILGAVTFNILPGIYNGSILLEEIAGSSAMNTVTFNGGHPDLVSIVYDGQGTLRSVISLDGSDYITIKNMTIQNTSLLNNGRGVYLTNAADHNTIDSCKIIVDKISSSSEFLPIWAFPKIGNFGNNANYTVISNCQIIGGHTGVSFRGSDVSTPDNTFNKVLNCNITDSYNQGIYFSEQDSPVISGNYVSTPRSTTISYSCQVSGKQPIITKNTFIGAKTKGLYLFDCNTISQSFTQNGLVANNMIKTSGNAEGLYLHFSDNINIFNNTIVSEDESALFISWHSNFLDIRNNIFETNINSSIIPAIDFESNPNGSSVINYNIYNAPVIANMGPSSYSSLASWLTAEPTINANSQEGDPGFVTPNNLHLAGSLAESAGFPIGIVSEDIDGDIRSTTAPDIGADEYTFCPIPTGLTSANISYNSTQLSWIASGAETEWNIEYGSAGFSQGSGTQALGITSTNYTLTSLISNNTYDLYIQADCNGSESFWTGPFTFTSDCQPFLAPYTESFVSNSTPSCWSQSSAVGGPWVFISSSGSLAPCGSTLDNTTGVQSNFAFLNQGGIDVGVVLTMNAIDVSALSTPFLEFYYSQCDLNMSVTNSLFIEAWDGISWAQVALVNDATDGDWQFYQFNISNYIYNSNLVKVRFRGESGGDVNDDIGDILIDDISILEAPACAMPASLNVNILNSSAAELSWTIQGIETEWTIEYGTTGFPLGSGTLINNVMSNVDTISGLLVNTEYEFYVRAECGNSSSGWSGPYSFIFEFCTPAPTNSIGASITEVVMGSINNLTTTELGNYGDYTYLSTDVNQGGQQEFYIEFLTSSAVGVNIWVDWNNDLVFDNTTELVYTGVSASSFPFAISAIFTIPPGASLGSHTLRIGGAQQFSGPGNPCYSGSNASFEDYTISVIPACTINIVDSQIACGSYIWRDGASYTSSNNIATDSIFSTNGGTCDTIYLLDLTINSSVSSIDTQEACDAFTWIDGNTYFANNFTAKDTLTTGTGCDSIITLNLIVNNSIQNTDVITACNSYTWIDGITYTTSNSTTTYTSTLLNGCDSIVLLDLTITDLEESVTQTNGIYLISNQPGATYKWLDCDNGNTSIGGANNQLFIAPSNGSYAVEVTYLNCIDTSVCISVMSVGLEDLTNTFANVYPNPVNHLLTISLPNLDNVQFELMDMQGKVIISSITISDGEKVDMRNLENGIYFVKLTSEDNRIIKRVVKN